MDALINELQMAQMLVLALAEDVDETAFRTQYHPDLSPLGWHLGHCIFTECLWLHEKIRGDDSVTAPIADFYTPPRTPKAERGRLLPQQDAMLTWARELQEFNLHFLSALRPEWREHELFNEHYILHFLIQHYSQHYETMLMVLTQKALAETSLNGLKPSAMQAQPPGRERIEIPAGHYRIGGESPTAYDNEVPPQHAELGGFLISRNPVSTAEFLGFIEDKGYQREDLWEADGRAWRQQHNVSAPDHWRQTDEGIWYGVSMRGCYELAPDEPVSGISRHEAGAFANWAGGRLPHEYQWEAACRSGVLAQTGRAWEWCDNTFHPYDGFKAFPYPEYSQPWFDENHYSLRGGCLHTRPAIKRPSFRNFFEPDKRHIFAGLRLVF
jgi:iron(II)-dependent oxidoreductase